MINVNIKRFPNISYTHNTLSNTITLLDIMLQMDAKQEMFSSLIFKGQIGSSQLYYLTKYLGLNPRLNTRLDKPNMYSYKHSNNPRHEDNLVTKLKDMIVIDMYMT